MIEETDFETFLYISKHKYNISVLNKKRLENLYSKDQNFNIELSSNNLEDLTRFLDDNIFKIEKLVGYFIKNITLIIENDKNLDVNIGFKEKTYEKSIYKKNLENNLIEIKDLFKENYQNQTIMHMLINSYIINGIRHSSYVTEKNYDHLCIETKFISIPNVIIDSLDELLKQIRENNLKHKEKINLIQGKKVPKELQRKVAEALELFNNESALLEWLENKANDVKAAKDL